MTQAHTATHAEPAEQFDERFYRKGEVEPVSTDALVPTNVLTKRGLRIYATYLKDTLVNRMDGNQLKAYVLVKQMEEINEVLKALLLDDALRKMDGNEMNIGGAKCVTRSKKVWQYDSHVLAKMDNDIKQMQEKMKAHRKALESEGIIVDRGTGVEEKAVLVSDGLTLSVTLPKE